MEKFLEDLMEIFIAGVTVTIPLTLVSFALGLVLALLLAVSQYANIKILKQISAFYIWLFRGTPLLVQLLIIFYLFSRVDEYIVAVIGFALNVAAYNAEAIRGALISVPKGQIEAGYLSGLKYPQILFRIIIPQAVPISLPSLFNNLISLLKDTSLATSIMVTELLGKARKLGAANFEILKYLCIAAAVYLVFCTLLTLLQNAVEKRLGWKTKPGRLELLRKRIEEGQDHA